MSSERKELALLVEASEVSYELLRFVHVPLSGLLDCGQVRTHRPGAEGALELRQLRDLAERMGNLVSALRAGEFDRYVLDIHGGTYAG